MRKTKKWLSLLLCAAMTLSLLAGCGGNGDTNNGDTNNGATNSGDTNSGDTNNTGDTENSGDLVTISASYHSMATTRVDEVPRLEKILADDLGIKLDVWISADPDAEASNMLAGGEYADLLMWYDKEKLQISANGGHLIDLAQYKDKLPAIFENPVMEAAIQRAKDECGDGEQVFYLPTRVGTQEDIYAWSPCLRFDVYQDIGAPKITDWDSFMDVLEQMVKAYPQTEDGLKTYALSLAGDDMFYFWEAVVVPRGVFDANMVVLLDQDLERVRSIFDADSELLAALKWMFELNQRGLLDPDGATQTADDYQGKVANGQIMYTPFNWIGAERFNTKERWNADDPQGYLEVWPECFVLPAFCDNICGNSRSVALTTDCEDLDAGLRYLNWLYSDGLDLYHNDVEGFLYTENEDGTRVPTQNWIDFRSTATNEDGSTHGDLAAALGGDPMITHLTINPNTNTNYGIEDQEAFKVEGEITKIEQQWRDWNGGYKKMFDKYKDTEQVCKLSPGFFLAGTIDDEHSQIQTDLGNLLKKTMVQMVYAKDEAEFNALWEQFKSDAYTLGYEEHLEYIQNFWAENIALTDKYSSLVKFK